MGCEQRADLGVGEGHDGVRSPARICESLKP